MKKRAVAVVVWVCCVSVWSAGYSVAIERLLTDYEHGGPFIGVSPANNFTNIYSQTNDAYDAGIYATVDWASSWSGASAYGGPTQDLDWADTYQVDIMVEEGQPLENGGAYYYCQFAYGVSTGWAWGEFKFAQTNVSVDGSWYRVQFPISNMNTNVGGGAEMPTNKASVNGVTAGMTGNNSNGTLFAFRTASFDNVLVSDAGITNVVVTQLQPGTNEFVLENYGDTDAFSFKGANSGGIGGLGGEGTNNARITGTYLTVDWSTKWCGGKSTGAVQNLEAYDSCQFDVRVPLDQPVETGANFYAQLNYGYDRYFEKYVPQDMVPADGFWRRVQFPFSSMSVWGGFTWDMWTRTNIASINGTTVGMTYDETGTNYLFKTANFRNALVHDHSVTGLVVEALPLFGSVMLVK